MTVTATAIDSLLVADARSSRRALWSYTPVVSRVSYPLTFPPSFPVALERAADGWIVVNENTGVHGAGATPLEATDDFRRAVLEHLDVLERQPELSAGLREQLEYLRMRVRPPVNP